MPSNKSTTTKFSSEGFDLDAVAASDDDGGGDQVVFEIGGGVKLPTGVYDLDLHQSDLPENFNVGSILIIDLRNPYIPSIGSDHPRPKESSTLKSKHFSRSYFQQFHNQHLVLTLIY